MSAIEEFIDKHENAVVGPLAVVSGYTAYKAVKLMFKPNFTLNTDFNTTDKIFPHSETIPLYAGTALLNFITLYLYTKNSDKKNSHYKPSLLMRTCLGVNSLVNTVLGFWAAGNCDKSSMIKGGMPDEYPSFGYSVMHGFFLVMDICGGLIYIET